MRLARLGIEHHHRTAGDIQRRRNMAQRRRAGDAAIGVRGEIRHKRDQHLTWREAVIAVPLGGFDGLARGVARHGQHIEIHPSAGARSLWAALRCGHGEMVAGKRQQAVRRVQHITTGHGGLQGITDEHAVVGLIAARALEYGAHAFGQTGIAAGFSQRGIRVEQAAEFLRPAIVQTGTGQTALHVVHPLADDVEDAILGRRVGLTGLQIGRHLLAVLGIEQGQITLCAQQRRRQRPQRDKFLVAGKRQGEAIVAAGVDVAELLLGQDVAEGVLGQAQQHHMIAGRGQGADECAERAGCLSGQCHQLQPASGLTQTDPRHQRLRGGRDLRQRGQHRGDLRTDAGNIRHRQLQEIVVAVECAQQPGTDEQRIGHGQQHGFMPHGQATIDDAVQREAIGICGHAGAAAAHPVVGCLAAGRPGGRGIGDGAVEVQGHAARILLLQMVHRTEDVVRVRHTRVLVDRGRVGVELQQGAQHLTAAQAAGLHQRGQGVGVFLGVEPARPPVVVPLRHVAVADLQLRRLQPGHGFQRDLGSRRVQRVANPVLRHTTPQALQIGAGVAVRLAKENVVRRDARGRDNGRAQLVLDHIAGPDGVEHQEQHLGARVIGVALFDEQRPNPGLLRAMRPFMETLGRRLRQVLAQGTKGIGEVPGRVDAKAAQVELLQVGRPRESRLFDAVDMRLGRHHRGFGCADAQLTHGNVVHTDGDGIGIRFATRIGHRHLEDQLAVGLDFRRDEVGHRGVSLGQLGRGPAELGPGVVGDLVIGIGTGGRAQHHGLAFVGLLIGPGIRHRRLVGRYRHAQLIAGRGALVVGHHQAQG